MRITVKIAFLFLLLSFLVNGQERQASAYKLNFTSFSTKDGLSQQSVTTILQDNQGFLWFGTRYGLNRFDGRNFKNYYYRSENPNSLSSSHITALVQDTKGGIWIGTKNGLNKYKDENEGFTRVKRNGEENTPYDSEIWDVKLRDTSYLWMATDDGLHRFNIKTNHVLAFQNNEYIPTSISSNHTRALLISKEGHLWVGTDKKIDLYRPETNTFEHYDYPNGASPQSTRNNTVELYQDRKGNIWLGYHHGLAIFNHVSGRFEDYKSALGLDHKISSPVRSIFEDRDGLLWVGTYGGLYNINLEEKRFEKYHHDITDPRSLSQNSVYSIVEDSRGDLWIGTWAGGINYLDRSSNIFTSLFEGPYKTNLNYKVVSSIVEDESNNLWVGTEGGGLNYYERKAGTFTHYTNDPKDDNSLSGNNVKAIIKDHLGNLWVGTHSHGLNHITLNGSKLSFKRFYSVQGDITSLSDNKITCLLEDNNHAIWIGTENGGLNVLDVASGKFSRIKDSHGIMGSLIYTITAIRNSNKLLVGSTKGLAKIDIRTNMIESINFKRTAQDSSIESKVISIYESAPNQYWIGTEGDGLYHYNALGETKRYGIEDGLPDEVIYGILPDSDAHLWMSTNKGLCRFNVETGQFQNFDESDGIQSNEFNYESRLITNKGELVFGGFNGFTIFDPSRITSDPFIPPVVIQSLNLRNRPYKSIATSPEKVTLKYNENDISFDYIALGFSRPHKIQYAYKLEGFDSEWNHIGGKTTATYTNLDHGNYTFKVKASNNEGVWNENIAALPLRIRPPFWKTWWAYTGYIILSVLLFLVMRKFALLRISERNALREERLERERMQELNKLKLQLFTNISHDFRTPLTLIIGPLKSLIKREHIEPQIRSQLTGIYRNAGILLQLINQLLDFRKMESGKLKLRISQSDIVPFIENIKLSFEELAKEKEVKYTFKPLETSLDVWFDQIEMKKVILNVLSNAFKFTPKKGKITLVVSKEEGNPGKVRLEIQDSGKGIPEKDIDFIFDRFFQLGQHNELRSGTGVGLAVAKDIVTLHKGTISVDSEKGKGTCFTILLPLGNAHIRPENIVHEEDSTSENDVLDYYDHMHVKHSWSVKKNPETTEIDKSLPSILVVEDNIEVRTFVKSVFQKRYNVFEAKNGKKGIEVARSNPIDLIISDVMMPKMDGMEMCRLIKTNIQTSHIPVILLTARTSSKVQKEGFETGADVYITKPFDADMLRLQVENLLKSRQNLIEKFRKSVILEPKELNLVSADEVFLKTVMEIVEQNISNPEFMASSLVDKLHMSQSVLYRKLKVLTGQSISEFIRTIKFKRAGQLISQTDMNISDVAYEIGFNDLKYFRKCFKQLYNQTPSEYRKSQIEDKEVS